MSPEGWVAALALAGVLVQAVFGFVRDRRALNAAAPRVDAAAEKTNVETAQGLVTTLRDELGEERKSRQRDRLDFAEQMAAVREELARLQRRVATLTSVMRQNNIQIPPEETP
jgi:uncharacterized protein YicC (UPF0701 family)